MKPTTIATHKVNILTMIAIVNDLEIT